MLTTIKNKVFSTLQVLFPTELYQMSKAAVDAAEKERHARKNAIEHETYKFLINKPVIAVGNDWSNPVIGIGLEVIGISKANNPRLVIKDYVTGEEVMPFGAVMEYNETRFEALMKLTPAEITSLVYRHSTPNSNFSDEQKEKRESREVILDKLTSNGFFEAIKNLKE